MTAQVIRCASQPITIGSRRRIIECWLKVSNSRHASTLRLIPVGWRAAGHQSLCSEARVFQHSRGSNFRHWSLLTTGQSTMPHVLALGHDTCSFLSLYASDSAIPEKLGDKKPANDTGDARPMEWGAHQTSLTKATAPLHSFSSVPDVEAMLSWEMGLGVGRPDVSCCSLPLRR